MKDSWDLWKTKAVKEKCPVCSYDFGTRLMDEILREHCEECKATFTFYPFEEKPTVEMDRKPAKKCTCASCKSR